MKTAPAPGIPDAEWNTSSLLQRSLDTIPDATFVKDLSHRWIVMNEAFCKLVGKPREWLQGKSDPDLFPPEQVKVFWEGDDRIFSSGAPNDNEEQIEHADGTTHTIWTRKLPMFDAQGQLVGLCGIITDVTSLQAQKDAIAELEAELAQQAALVEEQQNALRSAAVPVIQIWRNILLLPLIGIIEDERAVAIIETLLSSVVRASAKFALLDITGVPMVDTTVASYLVRAVQSTRLLGCRAILVGISPVIAQTIVSLGVDFSVVVTRATLQGGLEYALQHLDEEALVLRPR